MLRGCLGIHALLVKSELSWEWNPNRPEEKHSPLTTRSNNHFSLSLHFDQTWLVMTTKLEKANSERTNCKSRNRMKWSKCDGWEDRVATQLAMPYSSWRKIFHNPELSLADTQKKKIWNVWHLQLMTKPHQPIGVQQQFFSGFHPAFYQSIC